MAAITSNVTGTLGTPALWSATGTWSGGVVPISGTDTVSIAAGAVVILDAAACTASSLTVGTDPGTAGTAAVTIGTSSQGAATALLIDTGLTMRLKGDLHITGQNASGGFYSQLIMRSGSSLIMDPKSGAHYDFKFDYLAEIVSNGATNTGVWPDTTGGNHCVIKTDLARSGTAALPIFLGGLPNTQTVWGGFTSSTFTEFSNIGNATTFGVVWVQPNTNTLGYTTKTITMTNCTFSVCNYWCSDDGSAAYWTGQYQFNDNIFSSSVACTQFSFVSTCAAFSLHTAPTVSTKEILRNGFDLIVQLDGVVNITIQGNVFAGGLFLDGATAWSADTMFANNVIKCGTSFTDFGTISWGSIKGCYFVSTSANPTSFVRVVGGSSVTCCIFEAGVAFGDSAFAIHQNTAGTCTVKNNLIIGQFSNSGSGSLLWPFGGTGFNYVVEHNLMAFSTTVGMIPLGNNGAAASGQIISCRANICWAATLASGDFIYVITEAGSSTFTLDAVTLAGYNSFTTPSTGTCHHDVSTVQTGVRVYKQLTVTGAGAIDGSTNTQLGLGDFTADPTFVDSTRNFRKWGTGSVDGGGTATNAAVLAVLKANPSLITKASTGLFAYVLAGFVPTNAAYLHATYPGDAATTGADGLPLNGTDGPLGIQVPGGGGAFLLVGM